MDRTAESLIAPKGYDHTRNPHEIENNSSRTLAQPKGGHPYMSFPLWLSLPPTYLVLFAPVLSVESIAYFDGLLGLANRNPRLFVIYFNWAFSRGILIVR